MKLKILLIPVWEKLPSFKAMACSVWSSEPFTGLEVENTPPPVLIGLSHFQHILDSFQNTYVTLNVRILTRWQQKIKNNMSKFKFAH